MKAERRMRRVQYLLFENILVSLGIILHWLQVCVHPGDMVHDSTYIIYLSTLILPVFIYLSFCINRLLGTGISAPCIMTGIIQSVPQNVIIYFSEKKIKFRHLEIFCGNHT